MCSIEAAGLAAEGRGGEHIELVYNALVNEETRLREADWQPQVLYFFRKS
jgi:hypothetical protein